MTPAHLGLALLVVIVWGINFVIMKIGLHGIPPLLLSSIRFILVAFPAVFFLPRPKAAWKMIAAYGLTNFACQFGFMLTGIHVGMPPGLASLVLQTQAFFSMGLAAIIFKERPSSIKILGAVISSIGICIVGFYASGTPILMGFLCTLLAAMSWASGNMVSKRIATTSPLALVVWGSLMALPPILCLSLVIEGPTLIATSLSKLDLSTVGAVLYLVFLSTLFAYSIWGFLLNKYPAATIAPFSLLIPVVGFLSSSIFLGEEIPTWKIGASILVIAGVAVNIFEKKILRLTKRSKS